MEIFDHIKLRKIGHGIVVWQSSERLFDRYEKMYI